METCRICFDEEEASALLSPCSCAGTSQYVHTECLLAWIQASRRDRCEVCKVRFRLPEEFPLHVDTLAHRLASNPFLHIFVQYMVCVLLRPVKTYTLAAKLFLLQNGGTTALYVLYLAVLLSNRSVSTRRRYLQHPLMSSYFALVLFHTTLLLILFLSLDLAPPSSPPLLVVFMFLCHLCVSIYPLHHAYVAQALRQEGR